MGNGVQTTHGLLDIELPAIPLDTGLSAALPAIILLILLTLLAAITIRRFTGSRNKARRQLRRLYMSEKKNERRSSSTAMNAGKNRETAYQLARLLADGIGINGITAATALPAELTHLHERWHRFTSDLSTARYANQHCSPTSLDTLFRETTFWLKNWP